MDDDADIIEAMARGMYGKHWDTDDPKYKVGERMKDVWRKYCRDALSGLRSAGFKVQ